MNPSDFDDVTIKVATFNMYNHRFTYHQKAHHDGSGEKGRESEASRVSREARNFECIKKIDADFLLIQEVDHGYVIPGYACIGYAETHTLSGAAIYARDEVTREGKVYCHSLRCAAFMGDGVNPLRTSTSVFGVSALIGSLHLASVHLHGVPDEEGDIIRSSQIELAAKMMSQFDHYKNACIVIGGDFNTDSVDRDKETLSAHGLLEMSAGFTGFDTTLTTPRSLDRFLVSADLSGKTIVEKPFEPHNPYVEGAVTGSDHVPVVLIMKIPRYVIS